MHRPSADMDPSTLAGDSQASMNSPKDPVESGPAEFREVGQAKELIAHLSGQVPKHSASPESSAQQYRRRDLDL